MQQALVDKFDNTEQSHKFSSLIHNLAEVGFMRIYLCVDWNLVGVCLYYQTQQQDRNDIFTDDFCYDFNGPL